MNSTDTFEKFENLVNAYEELRKSFPLEKDGPFYESERTRCAYVIFMDGIRLGIELAITKI